MICAAFHSVSPGCQQHKGVLDDYSVVKEVGAHGMSLEARPTSRMVASPVAPTTNSDVASVSTKECKCVLLTEMSRLSINTSNDTE